MEQVVRTVCQACHAECGVLVRVVDGKAVRDQGDPEHPNNKGFSCIKAQAEINRLYHPDRLLHPMKRTGARGEGKWRQVSWDEALDAIAAGLTKVKDKYGAFAISGMRGTGPRAGGVASLVPYALGSPSNATASTCTFATPRLSSPRTSRSARRSLWSEARTTRTPAALWS